MASSVYYQADPHIQDVNIVPPRMAELHVGDLLKVFLQRLQTGVHSAYQTLQVAASAAWEIDSK